MARRINIPILTVYVHIRMYRSLYAEISLYSALYVT